jgi:hypothetical protein
LIDSEAEGARPGGPYDEEEVINSRSSDSPEGHDDSTEDELSDLLDFDDVWEAPTTRPDLPEMDSEMTNLWEQEVRVSPDANEGVDHHTHSASQQTQGKQTFIDKYPGDEAGRPASTPFTSAKCPFTVTDFHDFSHFSGLLCPFRSTTTCPSQLKSLKSNAVRQHMTIKKR